MKDDKFEFDTETPSDYDFTGGITDTDDEELNALLGSISFQSSDVSQPWDAEEPSAEIPASEKAPVKSRKQESAKKPRAEKTKKRSADKAKPEDSDEEQEKGGSAFSIVNVLLLLVALVLIAAIAVTVIRPSRISGFFEKRIPSGVSIGDVNVGDMKKAEAKAALKSAYGSSYSTYDMFVVVGETEIILSPSETGAKLDVDGAVQAAYDFGRSSEAGNTGYVFDILPYLNINTDAIRAKLEAIFNQTDSDGTPSGYALEGTRPALDAEMYDSSVPCQTLVLTLGTPGSRNNLDEVIYSILDAYRKNNFRVEIESTSSIVKPEPLDIDSIYQALYVAPVEAIENPTTHEVIPGSCGYTFSREDAQAKLAAAQYGDTVTVPMMYIVPQKLDIGNEYPELLSSYSCEVFDNEAYKTNISMLCKAVDGTVIQPGTTFSFNDRNITLSPYDGYLEAPMHGNNCAATIYGGGADQFATALHIGALCADLTIVERHSDDHVNDYAIHGTEVAIRNGMDLRILNSRTTPVLIRAKLIGSQLIIKLMSSQANDYNVTLDSIQLNEFEPQLNIIESDGTGAAAGTVLFEGLPGGTYRVERVRTDKTNGSEISRDLEIYIDLFPANKRVAG